MKNNKILMAASGAVLLLGGCEVHDPIFETEPAGPGSIKVVADWSGIGVDIPYPEAYTLDIDGYTEEVTTERHTVGKLFEPGTYPLYTYHPADSITISGRTATADYGLGPLGWFFSCARDIEVKGETDNEYTLPMKQQVRDLDIFIEPDEDLIGSIGTINCYLSGIAGTLDIANDTHGKPTEAPIQFFEIYDGTLVASIRLLGVVTGQEQYLTGTIIFHGGSRQDMYLEADMTAVLAGFNDNKRERLTLGGILVETQPGTEATIKDWAPVTRSGESLKLSSCSEIVEK